MPEAQYRRVFAGVFLIVLSKFRLVSQCGFDVGVKVVRAAVDIAQQA